MYQKLYTFLLTVLFAPIATAQTLDLSSGPNYPHLFNWGSRSGHFQSQYADKLGYSLGIGLENLYIADFLVRLSFELTRQQNSIDIQDGGLGGGTRSVAAIDKYLLGVNAYPLYINLPGALDLYAGGYLAVVIQDKSVGDKLKWLGGTPTQTTPFDQNAFPVNRLTNFGLAGRLSYPIKLTNQYCITPQYICLFGLTQEFVNLGTASPKLIQHQFRLGISRLLKGTSQK